MREVLGFEQEAMCWLYSRVRLENTGRSVVRGIMVNFKITLISSCDVSSLACMYPRALITSKAYERFDS